MAASRVFSDDAIPFKNRFFAALMRNIFLSGNKKYSMWIIICAPRKRLSPRQMNK